MKTLEQLLEERHSPIPTFTYNKDIPAIIAEWLMQERPYPKPTGPAVQELLKELQE